MPADDKHLPSSYLTGHYLCLIRAMQVQKHPERGKSVPHSDTKHGSD